MPKMPAGVTKTHRLEAVLYVLSHWGRLNKNQIDERVGDHLKVSADDIARSIYRDLEDLVKMGKIHVHYFTRDGREIDNYNSEQHKNTTCEWSIVKESTQFLGGKFVESANSQILVSQRLEKVISAEMLTSKINDDSIQLYFLFNNVGFCLKVSCEDLPVTILVGRLFDKAVAAKVLRQAEVKFGQRVALCLLPLPTLSSIDGVEKWGHFAVTMLSKNSGQLQDMGSKNGTAYNVLNIDQALELHMLAVASDQVTLPTKNLSMGKNEIERAAQCPKGAHPILFPACVYATQFLKILIA